MEDKRRLFNIIPVPSIMIGVLIFTSAGGVRAETDQILSSPVEEQATEVKTKEEKAAEKDIVSRRIKPGNITIDFKDAEIKTVLRVLSEKSGVNIVAGRDVEGFITIRLTNVHWETALDIICKNFGYAYEKEENIIRVTTLENLKQEELTTEVFTLNYAKADDVAEAIKEMLTERGKDKIKYDERTNVLIVTDIPTNLYKIRQVVEKLDAKTSQVLIEAKIIETTLDDDENLGIDWSIKFSASGAARPWVYPFETIGSRILGKFEMGDFLPVGKGAETAADQTTTTVPSDDFHSTTLSSVPLATTAQFTMGTLNFSEFSMILEYLKSRRDTEIISNPRVTTLNNKPAEILVGTIIAIPVFERNPDTGTIEITGYSERELGIKLDVTPHINDVGDIVVDLKPEVSDLLGYDTLDATRGITAPRYSVRQAVTQVMVRHGQTIMIGGLIKDNTVEYEKKVPFLGDIPAIGKWWFTKTEEAIDKTELIIFLTVRIIESSPETELVSRAFVPISTEKEKKE